MDDSPKPEGGGSDLPPQDDLASAIANVVQDQEEKAQVWAEVSGGEQRRTSPVVLAAFVLLSLVSMYLWFGSPSWLGPGPVSTVPRALADAGLRMEVFLAASNVEEYRALEGRLPNSLAEAGDVFSEVQYQRLDARRYRVWMAGMAEVIEFVSTDSLGLFLGDARQVILEGG